MSTPPTLVTGHGTSLQNRCKTFFVCFFYFGHVFCVFYLKNVGKVQSGKSGKQINKKHFQNNSNEIDL